MGPSSNTAALRRFAARNSPSLARSGDERSRLRRSGVTQRSSLSRRSSLELRSTLSPDPSSVSVVPLRIMALSTAARIFSRAAHAGGGGGRLPGSAWPARLVKVRSSASGCVSRRAAS